MNELSTIVRLVQLDKTLTDEIIVSDKIFKLFLSNLDISSEISRNIKQSIFKKYIER